MFVPGTAQAISVSFLTLLKCFSPGRACLICHVVSLAQAFSVDELHQVKGLHFCHCCDGHQHGIYIRGLCGCSFTSVVTSVQASLLSANPLSMPIQLSSLLDTFVISATYLVVLSGGHVSSRNSRPSSVPIKEAKPNYQFGLGLKQPKS